MSRITEHGRSSSTVRAAGGPSPSRRLWARVRDQVSRLARTGRLGQRPSQRPLPRVKIRLGPWVPGAVLRLCPAVVGLACVTQLAAGTVTWTFASAGALLMVLRPSGLVCALYALGVGFLFAVSASTPFAARSFLLLFGVHLLVQLGALAAGGVGANEIGWATVVDLHVFAAPARRFLALQGFAQLLALGGAALTTAAVTVPWLPVLVGVGLTALGWVLLTRLTAGSA